MRLDHCIVSGRDRRASAELLAKNLGVSWSKPDGHVWEALIVSYARQK